MREGKPNKYVGFQQTKFDKILTMQIVDILAMWV